MTPTPHRPPEIPELNGPQKHAVAHHDGPLLVFAGAGSGKTRVIVFRIANLIATHRVPPYRVLAVTFTNKAAGEMKDRLAKLVGEDLARDLWVGTFHSVCARLLRRYAESAGLKKSFVIYDDSDQKAVVNRVLKELDLDDKRYPVRQVLSRIHHLKQEGHSPESIPTEGYFDDAVRQCYARYEAHLRAANAVDFDDLLLHMLRILEDKESLAGQELRRRFSHVLVDEFQDVNQVQYRLVRAFSAETDNLCVVGDDDQSIYRWRGADVRVIRNFRHDHPRAMVVKLEQNYRSTGHIVKAALGVIQPAEEREPKEIWTANHDGEPILVVAADNERDEAAWVVEHLRALMDRGVSLKEVAVFYRVHAQSRVLEEVLRSEKIPYQIIGGTRFFERAEVKDLLSYLRVLVNPQSDVDLERIINKPSRKIGDTTVSKLLALATERGISAFEAIFPLIEEGGLGTAAKRALASFRELILGLMGLVEATPPSDLLNEVLLRTGYLRMLEEEDSAEADARVLNLKELVQSIVDYEEEARASDEPATLEAYLERVSLTSDADTIEDTARVAMMTVHAAKGLEFHTVFITGMEDEIFPFRGLDPSRAEDLEEERRLAYVAVTRARKNLVITHAARRAIFGQTRYGLPSRFLSDFPKSSLKSILTPAAMWMHRQGGFAGISGAFGGRSQDNEFGRGRNNESGRGRDNEFGRGRDIELAREREADDAGEAPRAPWKHPIDRAVEAQNKVEHAWVAPQANAQQAARTGRPADSTSREPAYVGRPNAKPAPWAGGRNSSFGGRAAARGAPAPQRRPGERYVERDDAPPAPGGFSVGGRVLHEVFGVGVVEVVDPGPDPAVTVRFSGHGKKRIKARFLKVAV